MTELFGDPDKTKKNTDIDVGSGKFWHRGPGRNRSYETGDDLVAAATVYFDWVHDTPMIEGKVFGSGHTARLPKARAMCVRALSVHLGIAVSTFYNYKDREENDGTGLSSAAHYIQAVMDAYNIEIAAAGLANGNIIARIMGLHEKVLHGSDPENPLPEGQSVKVYELPSNGRD